MSEQDTITQLQSDLAALRREQQDFNATVMHDLRAPLRHISAYALLLQEEAAPVLTDETRGFIGTITQAAATLSSKLDALGDYARLSVAQLNIDRVELSVLVSAIVRDSQISRLPADSAAVQWDIAPDLPAVAVDASLLRIALNHVLGNAVFFSHTQAVPVVVVSASVDTAAATVVLAVRDNGMGCDLGHTGRLFGVFARLHSTHQLRGLVAGLKPPSGFVPGLGMGLACTRRIVQRLGGRVAMQSEPGGGCTVYVHLPLATPQSI